MLSGWGDALFASQQLAPLSQLCVAALGSVEFGSLDDGMTLESSCTSKRFDHFTWPRQGMGSISEDSHPGITWQLLESWASMLPSASALQILNDLKYTQLYCVLHDYAMLCHYATLLILLWTHHFPPETARWRFHVWGMKCWSPCFYFCSGFSPHEP